MNNEPETCILHTQIVIIVFMCLGWAFKKQKCELVPSQTFVHLGFVFNTKEMLISCTPEKVSRLQQMCLEMYATGETTVLKLEQLIGTIESVRPAVKLAALHYRALQSQLLHAKCKIRVPSKIIVLCQSSIADLKWWIAKDGFVANSSAPIRELEPTVNIWSDANLTMGGAHCSRGNYYQREWTQAEQGLHINHLELRAARESLALAQPGDRVRLHLDNKCAVSYISRQGGTRSSTLNHEACLLWKESLSLNLTLLTPNWLSTTENVTADFLSRNTLGHWECRLSNTVFLMVLDHFSVTPTLDVFASHATHQLPRYMTWYQDPMAVGQNAMIHPWDPVSYLFPPVPLIMKSLQKIQRESLEVIMICPRWPSALWWPHLTEMLVDPILSLPSYKSVLTMMEDNVSLPYLNPLIAVHLKAQA